MILSRFIIVLLASIYSINGFSQFDHNIRKEYYAVLPFWESPYVPFNGACSITEDEAKKRIHLQLDFDQQDRIVMVHVKQGEEYKDFEGFFGNLYINAPITRVAYDLNEEFHFFFDRFNNRITVQGGIGTKIYTKDDHGRNIQLRFLDKDGNTTEDQFGNMTYHWIHQEDGSIIEERRDKAGKITPLRGGFQFLRTRMLMGKDGYFEELQNINNDGGLINAECGAAVLKYYYDDQGRFLRWEVYDKDGQKAIGPSHTSGEVNTFYKYDLENIIFFDTLGNPAMHWSGAERWHFDVDEYGNRIALTYQNREGKPMNANRGFARIKFQWSDDGRYLQSQSYFDKDGNKTLHGTQGIHAQVNLRDKQGFLLETLFVNQHGDKVERRDNGVARMVYEYNEKGKLIKTFNYNLEGEIIN